MTNSEFFYLYRDGANCKNIGSLIFANPDHLTLDCVRQRLTAALDERQYFIADQVSVPNVFLWSDEADYDPYDESTFPDDLGPGTYLFSDDDHCWHEFHEIVETSKPATDPRTLTAFLEEVESAGRAGWKEFTPAHRA